MRWIGAVVAGLLALGLGGGGTKAGAALPDGVTKLRVQACLVSPLSEAENPPCKKMMSTKVWSTTGQALDVGLRVRASGRCSVAPYTGPLTGNVYEAEAMTVRMSGRMPKGFDGSKAGNICIKGLAADDPVFSPVFTGERGFAYPMTRGDAKRKVLGWSIRIHGRQVRAGRLIVTTKILRHERTRTIWQGTDSFINLCINSSERLWSRGGRLYCNWTEPGIARVTARLR